MEEKIKRYYSIIDLIDDSSDRMGDERLLLLFNYLDHQNVKVFQGCSEKEELEKYGIFIINNSYIAYTFIYPVDINGELDRFSAIERKIIEFAHKKCNLRVEEIKARLDYENIRTRLYSKCIYLTEDVLIPDNYTDYEAYIVTYLNNLTPANNTLIITDPYLFPKNSDSNYERMIQNILEASHSRKIITYIPKAKLNIELFSSVCRYLNTIGIELEHRDREDIHDRFWICVENVKGFIMGTSLNGIGKKICRVDNLIEEEVEIVVAEVS